MSKRPYGTGSLFIRTDVHGREIFYAQWRSNGRLVKRRLGFKRVGSGPGMTKGEAEKALRGMIDTVRAPVETMTLADAARRWLDHLEARGRRRSTLMDYESAVRVHLVPFFGERPMDRITADDPRQGGLLRNHVGG